MTRKTYCLKPGGGSDLDNALLQANYNGPRG